MDWNNWRAAGAGDGAGVSTGAVEGAMDSDDWRTQRLSDSRQRIVNNMLRGKEVIEIEMDIDTHDSECIAPAVFAAGASARGLSTTAPLDITTQTGNANGADWQEEVFQKIKPMKEMYLSKLNDIYQKIVSAIQRFPQHETIEMLEIFKMTLERIVHFLRLDKHDIQLIHKEKLLLVEKYISFFLSCKGPHNPTSSPLHGKIPPPSMHTSQAQNTYTHQTLAMDSGGQDIASDF